MSSPKGNAEQYLRFWVVSPVAMRCPEAAPVHAGPLVAHAAAIRLMHRREPDAATRWQEALRYLGPGLASEPAPGDICADDICRGTIFSRSAGAYVKEAVALAHPTRGLTGPQTSRLLLALFPMLPTQNYFSNAVGSVDFSPEDGYLFLHWSGAPMTSNEFRALYTHAHNLLRRYPLRGLLADHRAMPAAPEPADRDWLLNTWLPAVLEDTAFERYAVVPTLTLENRLHTPAVAAQLRRVVTTAFFEEIPPATEWLRADEIN